MSPAKQKTHLKQNSPRWTHKNEMPEFRPSSVSGIGLGQDVTVEAGDDRGVDEKGETSAGPKLQHVNTVNPFPKPETRNPECIPNPSTLVPKPQVYPEPLNPRPETPSVSRTPKPSSRNPECIPNP